MPWIPEETMKAEMRFARRIAAERMKKFWDHVDLCSECQGLRMAGAGSCMEGHRLWKDYMAAARQARAFLVSYLHDAEIQPR